MAQRVCLGRCRVDGADSDQPRHQVLELSDPSTKRVELPAYVLVHANNRRSVVTENHARRVERGRQLLGARIAAWQTTARWR